MIFKLKPVVSNQVIISSMFALLLVLRQSCLDVALTFHHCTPRHVGEKGVWGILSVLVDCVFLSAL